MNDSGSFRVVGTGVGLVVLVAAAVGMVLVVTSVSDRTSWTDLEVGTCIDLAGSLGAGDVARDDEVFAVETIPCGGPLRVEQVRAEVLAVGDLNVDGDDPYPTSVDLLASVDARCASLDVDTERFGVLPIVPDERTWADRRGRYVCLAVPYGG